MKANELQIGDWVLWGEQHSNIDGDYDLEFYPHQIELTDFFFLHVNDWEENDELEFVKPIQLDEEILKANGFDGHYLWFKEGETNGDTEYVEMELTQEGSMFFFIRRTWNNGQFKGVLKYVHELQHALRECELNELVDNFKVEYYERAEDRERRNQH